MTSTVNPIWQRDTTQQFARVTAAITDVTMMQNFLRDVLTEKEIMEISSRLEAANLLNQGKKYTEIIEKTSLSSRTIARISEWMQNGQGGYKAALQLTNVHHSHLPPARAE